ncbi:Transposase [Bacteroidales bacterium Barb6XT]|nr:Transposase [Bacteroidales bacterium Barb6XT]
MVYAEYTGQYIWTLCCVCRDLSIDLWLENPAQIRHSSDVQRDRNDRLDARKIAAYGFRFQDKARLYDLPQENITSLWQLTGERDMYVGDKSKYQGQLTDQERFMRKQDHKQKERTVEKIDKGVGRVPLSSRGRNQKHSLRAMKPCTNSINVFVRQKVLAIKQP